ncbi:hypothetical protein [Qipengyuania sp. MTN3-11]|uniref:hypothetical protein n=1 Tax=Qipengyuania sp. MTN3-11 TaxID=3056557 RepID=UPI0036F376F2
MARGPAEGTRVEYDGSGGYTITRNDGQAVTFGDAQIIEELQTATQYRVTNNGIQNDIVLSKVQAPPVSGRLSLTYHVIGVWTQVNTTNPGDIRTNEFFVFGNKTQNLPTGTATYDLTDGIGLTGTDRTFTAYNFLPNSTGSLSVDFGAGSLSTNLNLIGLDETNQSTRDFGSFSGSGNITSGADFSGIFAAGGEFFGSFFGPAAEEVGFVAALDTPQLQASGTVSGTKD